MSRTKQMLQHASRTARVTLARVASPGRIGTGEALIVGKHLRVGKGRRLETGSRVFIGSDFHCMTNAVIGDDVMISSSVAFIGDDHPFDDPDVKITDSPRNPAPTVVVEGDNLIGYRTVVVGNVTIGKGAIVAAGSLVTRDLLEAAVYAGRPAVKIRARYRS